MKVIFYLLLLMSASYSVHAMQPDDQRVPQDKAQENPLWNRATTPETHSTIRHPSPVSFVRPTLTRTQATSPARVVSPTRLRAALQEVRRNSIAVSAEIEVREPAIKKQPMRTDSPRVAILKLRTSNNKLSPHTAEEMQAIFDMPCDAKQAIESVDLEALGLELNTAIKQNDKIGKGVALDGMDKLALERKSCAERILEARRAKEDKARQKLRRASTIS